MPPPFWRCRGPRHSTRGDAHVSFKEFSNTDVENRGLSLVCLRAPQSGRLSKCKKHGTLPEVSTHIHLGDTLADLLIQEFDRAPWSQPFQALASSESDHIHFPWSATTSRLSPVTIRRTSPRWLTSSVTSATKSKRNRTPSSFARTDVEFLYTNSPISHQVLGFTRSEGKACTLLHGTAARSAIAMALT